MTLGGELPHLSVSSPYTGSPSSSDWEVEEAIFASVDQNSCLIAVVTYMRIDA